MYKYKNIIRFVCYLIFLAGALAYPVKQIRGFEFPKVSPSVYQFRVSMLDPYDPLRGRFLQLSVKPSRLETEDTFPKWGTAMERRPPLAVLGTGEDGAACVTALVASQDQVPKGRDYIRLAGINHASSWDNGKPVAPYYYHLTYPFDSLFINEKKAESVGKLLRPGADGAAPGILVVKVFPEGNFMVEDLLVNGKSIL